MWFDDVTNLGAPALVVFSLISILLHDRLTSV